MSSSNVSSKKNMKRQYLDWDSNPDTSHFGRSSRPLIEYYEGIASRQRSTFSLSRNMLKERNEKYVCIDDLNIDRQINVLPTKHQEAIASYENSNLRSPKHTSHTKTPPVKHLVGATSKTTSNTLLGSPIGSKNNRESTLSTTSSSKSKQIFNRPSKEKDSTLIRSSSPKRKESALTRPSPSNGKESISSKPSTSKGKDSILVKQSPAASPNHILSSPKVSSTTKSQKQLQNDNFDINVKQEVVELETISSGDEILPTNKTANDCKDNADDNMSRRNEKLLWDIVEEELKIQTEIEKADREISELRSDLDVASSRREELIKDLSKVTEKKKILVEQSGQK